MTIFRVDFGYNIGLGHLMRSLIYAKRFNKVAYISKSNKKKFVPHRLITIQNEDEFFLHVERLKPKQVVVDHYNFTLEHEKEFKRRFPAIKLIVFDDDYRKHICDEIINHNISADIKKYGNPRIVSIISPLIREEFYKAKRMKFKKDGIFVSFGGSDAKNLTLSTLDILKDKKINLYTTSFNKNIKQIKEYAKYNKNIDLNIDKNVAVGMAKSKFGIITPSTIAHEALFMDLPFIAIQTADNQKEMVQYLKKYRQITILNKLDKQVIGEFFK